MELLNYGDSNFTVVVVKEPHVFTEQHLEDLLSKCQDDPHLQGAFKAPCTQLGFAWSSTPESYKKMRITYPSWKNEESYRADRQIRGYPGIPLELPGENIDTIVFISKYFPSANQMNALHNLISSDKRFLVTATKHIGILKRSGKMNSRDIQAHIKPYEFFSKMYRVKSKEQPTVEEVLALPDNQYITFNDKVYVKGIRDPGDSAKVSYNCPFCYSSYTIGGNPRQRSKPLEHRHGGFPSSKGFYEPIVHCGNNGRFPEKLEDVVIAYPSAL